MFCPTHKQIELIKLAWDAAVVMYRIVCFFARVM